MFLEQSSIKAMESAENQEQLRSSNDNDRVEQNSDSLSRTETIKLLNDSIDRLEQTVAEISKNRTLPSARSIETLSTTTQELIAAVTPQKEPPPVTEITTQPQPTTPQPESPFTVKSPVDPQQPVAKPVVKAQRKKSLSIIAICIAAIAVAIVAVFQIWLPRQEASQLSNIDSVAEPTVTEIGEVNSPESTIAETQLDNSLDTVEPTVVELPSDSEPHQPIPPDLESPGREKNLKLVAIEPNLDFTPEQTLVAALGTKVAALTQKYPSELFDLIEVDLPQNSLTVNVTDDWYDLDPSRQAKLANEMLDRSRQLNFAKLKLQDRQGTLVARNPVIGDRIIIVQDTLNAD